MSILRHAARHERTLLLGGAALVAIFAWAEVWRRASPGHAVMDGMMMPWSTGSAVLMWSIMMVAMMLPSAIPALLIFQAAQRQTVAQGALLARTVLFATGYLLVWSGWAILAALLQGWLQARALLSPDLAAASPLVGASVLLVAGAYQFTPWKRACLEHCRSPQDFLVLHWRQGPGGALAMGVHHGAFCVGCCWALMTVLFVVGIMNIAWVALLAAIVLVEKAIARGPWMSRASGAILVAWAAYLAYVGIAN